MDILSYGHIEILESSAPLRGLLSSSCGGLKGDSAERTDGQTDNGFMGVRLPYLQIKRLFGC